MVEAKILKWRVAHRGKKQVPKVKVLIAVEFNTRRPNIGKAIAGCSWRIWSGRLGGILQRPIKVVINENIAVANVVSSYLLGGIDGRFILGCGK